MNGSCNHKATWGEEGELKESGQKVGQIKSIRKISTRDKTYNMMTLANCAVGCLAKVLREQTLRVLITRKLVFSFHFIIST